MWTAQGRRLISLGVGAVLAAVFLYYSLRGLDWREGAPLVTGAAPGGLILTAGIGTVSLFLRACRWRILLNAEGAVGVSTAFWATAAGYFGNNFLPARAGELVRSFMISSRSALGNTYVLATALSERVADAIALVVISAAVLLILPAQPGWLGGAARPFAILGVFGALAIAILPLLGGVAQAAIERLPLPPAQRSRLTTAVAQGLRGMRAFHSVPRRSGFLGLTVLIWSLDAVGTAVAGRALAGFLPPSRGSLPVSPPL